MMAIWMKNKTLVRSIHTVWKHKAKYAGIIILVLSVYFRTAGLGFSDFQGDEIAAQNYLFHDRGLKDFILSRPIPLGQYVVTYLANVVLNWASTGRLLFDPLTFDLLNFQHAELVVRLPFMLASNATLLLIYYIVRREVSTQSALYVSMFIGLNGLVIAFSRIAQYQSVIMLISVLNLVVVAKLFSPTQATYRAPWKLYLVLGLLHASGLMFHYDAITFVLPTLGVLVLKAIKKPNYRSLAAYLVGLAPLVIFLFYYFSSAYFAHQTSTYLLSTRIMSAFEYDSVYYSYKLLRIYMSKEALWLLIGLGFSGVVRLAKKRNFVPGLVGLLVLVRLYYQVPVNILIYLSSGLTFGLVGYYLIKSKFEKDVVVELTGVWFLFSLASYVFFIRQPLTHIYTALVPGLILVGIWLPSLIANRLLRTLVILGFVIAQVSYNYAAFFNTSTEYPIASTKYIFGSMPAITTLGFEVKGIFGFPHSEKLPQVRKTMDQLNKVEPRQTYVSNKSNRVLKYYLKGYKNSTESARSSDFYYVEFKSSPPLALDMSRCGVKMASINYSIYACSSK